jgi:hypothetical protein
MTDRIRHLTVVLDADYRDDDVKPIVAALWLIRGVSLVETHVVGAQDHLARMTVQAEIERDLHEAIDGVFMRKKIAHMAAEGKKRT